MSRYPLGMNTWRAGCGESRTSGSEGGPEKPTHRKTREGASVRPYTYLRLKGGFAYLVAIMDWHSRYVLAWDVSMSMEARFCVVALEEALAWGRPQIFNSDQGSQFTAAAFTQVLLDAGIQISMDGRGRVFDNIMIERLWRTVKYEDIFLKDYLHLFAARDGLEEYFDFYNHERRHSSLAGKTPAAVYWAGRSAARLAG